MSAPFVHLCVHSTYSLCESALQIEELVELADSFNMPAVSVTDTNNLFGAFEFSGKAASHGIQPIIGCQLNVIYDENNKKQASEHIHIYAKTKDGYYNLMQLVTSAHLESCCDAFPCVSMQLLEHYSRDIIALTGGQGSTFNNLLTARSIDSAVTYLTDMKSIFSDNLYVEIQRHHVAAEREIESDLLNIAYDNEIPVVCTNNVCFAKREDLEAHEVLLCIGDGTTIDDDNRKRSNPEFYFKSSDEMLKLFSDIPDTYINTAVIAQRCSFMLVPKKPIMPEVQTDGGVSQDEQLRRLAINGLENRLQTFVRDENYSSIKEKYYERLNYELDMIKKMGFSGYFLIICDYVQWAKKNNIPVGPGRGSGAGSLVAYSLTITNVDPIRFNLFFERFLNPERVSMPDVDIDFCQSRRDEVIQYVQDKYGKESVAQIITFGKLQARAAVKDVGRALGLPYGLTDRISKMIPFVPTNPVTLAQAVKQEKSIQDEINNDYQVKHLVDVALMLEGVCKHTSVHAAGIVITDKIIRDIAPLYKDPKATMPVTQFSMKYIESTGLIKFDFLGLKTLTVIQKAVDLINERTKSSFSIDDIPLDDKNTFDMLKRVDCVGIFQLESSGMKDVIRKLKPDKIDDIIALVALYRPGPMDDIPKYIACKHGDESITYLDKRLEPILSETYGVMVYQEQVMQIAQVIGGYTLGQADILRRAMGKKQHDEMNRQKEKFITGAKVNGMEETVAERIFDLMSKFASYGFNKSHSTPYGLISYQTAYLKANYAIEFYAAIMTLDMDATDKIYSYYNDAKKHRISITPPDINQSCDSFIVDYEHNAIIYSLSALKGSGHSAVLEIERERNTGGLFESIFDFVDRMGKYNIVNRKLLECFINAGVFDSLHENRFQLLGAIDMLLAIGHDTDQGMLFEKCYPELPKVPDRELSEKLGGEMDAIGFYVSSHPLDEYSELLKKLDTVSIVDVYKFDKARIAGVILSVQRKTAKNDSRFVILGVSDNSGPAEVSVFSELLEKSGHLLSAGNMVIVEVNVSKNGDNIRLTATNIYDLNSKLSLDTFDYSRIEPITNNTSKVSITINNRDDLVKLQQEISGYGCGRIQIELNIPNESKNVILPGKYSIGIREFMNLRNRFGQKNVNHD